MDGREITSDESLAFRRMRLALPFLLALFLLVCVAVPGSLWCLLSFALLANFVFYVAVWPCPRCGKFYSSRFGFWPYSSCLHCGSRVRSAHSHGRGRA